MFLIDLVNARTVSVVVVVVVAVVVMPAFSVVFLTIVHGYNIYML